MSLSRYIMPLLLVILSGMLYVIYIEPTYQHILAVRAEKLDYEDAIRNASEVRSLQAQLLAAVEGIDPVDRARLDKLLPLRHDPVLVVFDLNTFAAKHGLVLRAPSTEVLATEEGETQKGVVPIVVRFSVSAPYAVFRTFIADLERELAIRDIRNLSIMPSGESRSESAIFTYQIEAEGYALEGPPAVAE